MSPSTSQQWDFETLSMLSQPAVIEEILEEPEKPSCWRSTRQCFALVCESLILQTTQGSCKPSVLGNAADTDCSIRQPKHDQRHDFSTESSCIPNELACQGWVPTKLEAA